MFDQYKNLLDDAIELKMTRLKYLKISLVIVSILIVLSFLIA